MKHYVVVLVGWAGDYDLVEFDTFEEAMDIVDNGPGIAVFDKLPVYMPSGVEVQNGSKCK